MGASRALFCAVCSFVLTLSLLHARSLDQPDHRREGSPRCAPPRPPSLSRSPTSAHSSFHARSSRHHCLEAALPHIADRRLQAHRRPRRGARAARRPAAPVPQARERLLCADRGGRCVFLSLAHCTLHAPTDDMHALRRSAVLPQPVRRLEKADARTSSSGSSHPPPPRTLLTLVHLLVLLAAAFAIRLSSSPTRACSFLARSRSCAGSSAHALLRPSRGPRLLHQLQLIVRSPLPARRQFAADSRSCRRRTSRGTRSESRASRTTRTKGSFLRLSLSQPAPEHVLV